MPKNPQGVRLIKRTSKPKTKFWSFKKRPYEQAIGGKSAIPTFRAIGRKMRFHKLVERRFDKKRNLDLTQQADLDSAVTAEAVLQHGANIAIDLRNHKIALLELRERGAKEDSPHIQRLNKGMKKIEKAREVYFKKLKDPKVLSHEQLAGKRDELSRDLKKARADYTNAIDTLADAGITRRSLAQAVGGESPDALQNIRKAIKGTKGKARLNEALNRAIDTREDINFLQGEWGVFKGIFKEREAKIKFEDGRAERIANRNRLALLEFGGKEARYAGRDAARGGPERREIGKLGEVRAGARVLRVELSEKEVLERVFKAKEENAPEAEFYFSKKVASGTLREFKKGTLIERVKRKGKTQYIFGTEKGEAFRIARPDIKFLSEEAREKREASEPTVAGELDKMLRDAESALGEESKKVDPFVDELFSFLRRRDLERVSTKQEFIAKHMGSAFEYFLRRDPTIRLLSDPRFISPKEMRFDPAFEYDFGYERMHLSHFDSAYRSHVFESRLGYVPAYPRDPLRLGIRYGLVPELVPTMEPFSLTRQFVSALDEQFLHYGFGGSILYDHIGYDHMYYEDHMALAASTFAPRRMVANFW